VPDDCLIGLISDTHGLLRDAALAALQGSSVILHAGDVGGDRILRALRAIAPVHAVRGNVDDTSDPSLLARVDLLLGGRSIHMSHGHELGSPTPDRLLRTYDADIVIYGHTHRALVHWSGPRLVLNPGAAGPRRFNLQPSVARVRISDGRVEAEIVPLV
jgi:putative phosphoesterase